ncbi:MarR family winged helix-turn-helix transcriptional regulator [Acidovorax sp. BL-A-41-H1]|uniref:MarR family winged helix-turn-helix transcriptional regulator n=1 Tax=Acidovorax sp. BL-A-41-H1 TaxID=3421102 RepID=UPI003F79C2F5
MQAEHTRNAASPTAPEGANAATVSGAAPQPQGCTNFKLRQLLRRVGSHYDAEMARCGLKTTQYSLLSHVLKLGPIRPGDLATAMKMDASTLTRNLRPLVDAGWVTLEAGADARSRLVHITDTGREKRAEAQRHWKAAQLALNEALGVERVLALHALVDDSLELLAALPAAESGEAD